MDNSGIQMLFNEDDIENVDIFLGGTCGNDEHSWDWRRQVIAHIPDHISYYDPFIREWEYPGVDWNDEFIAKENIAKENCKVAIYVLTPDMQGVYSIAEITAHLCSDRYKATGSGVMIVIEDGDAKLGEKTFSMSMRKSLNACAKLWESHGASILSFEELIDQIDKLGIID